MVEEAVEAFREEKLVAEFPEVLAVEAVCQVDSVAEVACQEA
jgi:hypothetical protein